MIGILLVEGHPYISRLLKSKIEMEPDLIVIGEASDKPSAIELAMQTTPDLILLDFDSLYIEGMEITGELHKIHPDRPVILLSFFDDPALRLQAFSAGAFGLIAKEVDTDVLLSAIRHAVSPSGLRNTTTFNG